MYCVVNSLKYDTKAFEKKKCRLACKEINVGGHRGWRLRIVEAFIIILTVTELLYVLLVHAGLYSSRYGPGYRDTDYGMGTHPTETGVKGTTGVGGTRV